MRIIELKIEPDDELSGVDFVSLVNSPAMEANWFAFNDVNMDEFLFEKILEDVLTEEEKKTKTFKKVVDVNGQLAFDNIEDALIYAKGIGCEGSHEHVIDGETFYMACNTHDDPAYDSLEKEGLSEDFNNYEDLPTTTQEKLLERMGELGRTTKTLQDDGYVILGEEEFEKNLGFGSLPTKSSAKPDLPTVETNGAFKILYKYKGPRDSKNRNFCRRLLDLDLLFRKEDIQKMTLLGDNSQEFGYYNIMEFKGSFGCRHRWTKVYVYQKQSDLPAAVAQLLDRPKEGLSKERLNFSMEGEQMMVTGALIRPDKLIFRVDENNEPYFVFFSRETIKMIAKKMLEKKYLDKMNLEHDSDQPVNGQLIETWFVEDQERDKQHIYGFNYEPGTWMATFKINDPAVWQMVKDGTVKGFSVEGIFDSRFVQ